MRLETSYMGLPLKHPIIASASPLSQSLDGIRKLEDANASAIVMFSLFEEQIRHENAMADALMSAGTESFGESLSYFPDLSDNDVGPDDYLNLVSSAVDACDVPIIASLNGVSDEGWTDYARLLQHAGASAIELNIYYIPATLEETGTQVEQRYVDVVSAVKGAVGIPVAVKLNPYFSAFGAMAKRLAESGADGLVMFNRFYRPDFDIDTLAVEPTLELSQPSEIRLPLLWIAVLAGKIDASIAATTGVHSPEQAIKYLLAGADTVMTTSSLLANGPDHLGNLVDGLSDWMAGKGYEDIGQLRGAMSQRHVADPAAFERANYIKVLKSY